MAGQGKDPERRVGELQGKGEEKPEHSASQAASSTENQRQRRAEQGGGVRERVEEGGERGLPVTLSSHTLLPQTFISDTKEEARPLGEAGAAECIFSPACFRLPCTSSKGS